MSRASGRTTKQMEEAPHGAHFLWCNEFIEYPRSLAKKIGRDDLRIVSPSWLETGWRGIELSGLVVDHTCRLTEQQEIGLSHAVTRIRLTSPEGGRR